MRLVETETFGKLGRHRLDAHADPAALGLAELDELIDGALHDGRRNGEAETDRAAGRRDDRRVHADHIAVHVEQRPARITPVDGGVGLDEIVIRPRRDVAVAGRDDAGRHRAAEPERVADRHHPVADPHRVRIAERDGGQRRVRLHAQHRKIGLLVLAHQFGGEAAAVREVDRDFVGALDDVIVGDDDAAGVDHEARAERGHLARLLLFVIVLEHLLIGRAGRELRHLVEVGPVDLLAGRDVDHGRGKPRRQIRETVGRGTRQRRRRRGRECQRRRKTGRREDAKRGQDANSCRKTPFARRDTARPKHRIVITLRRSRAPGCGRQASLDPPALRVRYCGTPPLAPPRK